MARRKSSGLTTSPVEYRMPGRDAVQGVAHGDRPEPLRDGTGGIEPAIEVRLRQGLEVPERGPANLLRGGDDRVPVVGHTRAPHAEPVGTEDRKSTRLNSSHVRISYAVFCLKKKKTT